MIASLELKDKHKTNPKSKNKTKQRFSSTELHVLCFLLALEEERSRERKVMLETVKLELVLCKVLIYSFNSLVFTLAKADERLSVNSPLATGVLVMSWSTNWPKVRWRKEKQVTALFLFLLMVALTRRALGSGFPSCALRRLITPATRTHRGTIVRETRYSWNTIQCSCSTHTSVTHSYNSIISATLPSLFQQPDHLCNICITPATLPAFIQ